MLAKSLIKKRLNFSKISLDALLGCLVLVLPVCLLFSYHPVITLGASETMNFELSIPLLWLVVFDVVGFIWLCKKGKLLKGLKGKWLWLLFPLWLTLSLIWSQNRVRGLLTVGILWLIWFAGYVIWSLREIFDVRFWQKWAKWFLVASLVVCGWCLLQCVLDLCGVSRDASLMCAGCTYKMFGFPHPNGFAIEPQFMGNLLLAPVFLCVWSLFLKADCMKSRLKRLDDSCTCKDLASNAQRLDGDCCKNNNSSGFLWICFAAITATLFLTFSRGAIYSFVIGFCFLSGFVIFRTRKSERRKAWRRVGMLFGATILSFLMVLNLQGLMSAVSPTSDTYFDGVSKVVNQLTLGVIDLGGRKKIVTDDNVVDIEVNTGINQKEDELVVSVEDGITSEGSESVFDGYVEESTNTRLRLNDAALKIWSMDTKNLILGVGLGGAGQALYKNGLSPAPKEIIQNEYLSILLETGAIGFALAILVVVLFVKVAVRKKNAGMTLAMMVAFGVSLMFFSGLPNALHIYLLLALFAFS